jgi:hypothetical protein
VLLRSRFRTLLASDVVVIAWFAVRYRLSWVYLDSAFHPSHAPPNAKHWTTPAITLVFDIDVFFLLQTYAQKFIYFLSVRRLQKSVSQNLQELRN